MNVKFKLHCVLIYVTMIPDILRPQEEVEVAGAVCLVVADPLTSFNLLGRRLDRVRSSFYLLRSATTCLQVRPPFLASTIQREISRL